MRAIRKNDIGAAVEDVQKRLHLLGYKIDIDGDYGAQTAHAVKLFRKAENLPEGDCVDKATWNALVDASFSMGDRMLYLRLPHFHGQDVEELQTILSVLGFVVGDEDGIFGPHTEHALREFQSSAGLPDDGIAGKASFEAIERLRHAWEGKTIAIAEDINAHMSFSRAAEALQNLEACFFGLDDTGRQIAKRIANLAHATSETARVTSADALHEFPSGTTIMVGIVTSKDFFFETGDPVINFEDTWQFSARVSTALNMAKGSPRRMYIEVSLPKTNDGMKAKTFDERALQHVAVVLLDSFCSVV